MGVDNKRADADDAPTLAKVSTALPWATFGIALVLGGVFVICALPAAGELMSTPGAIPAAVLMGPLLVALGTVDLRSLRLPDALTLPLGASGLLFCLAYGWDSFAVRLLAIAGGFAALYVVSAVYERVRGRAGLGLGDAKLLAAGGAWVGLEGLPPVLLIGCITALIGVAALMATGRSVNTTTRLPFGPFLCLGIWIVWLYGPLA
jgi:leader peptidase (prepilin peptidase)/N-methyltransferase